MKIRYFLSILFAFSSCYNQTQTAYFSENDEKLDEVPEEWLLLNQWFKAASAGNVEQIQKLVGKVDINARDYDDDTALTLAARDEKMVKFLLQVRGIDVNAQNSSGTTALMDACFARGNAENITKMLLQVPGINVNIQNGEGETALHWANMSNKENIAKLLLEAGMNVNSRNKEQRTPLMDAVTYQNENIVKLLLQAPGIDIHAQDKNGNTAFSIASRKSNGAILNLIFHELMRQVHQAISASPTTEAERIKNNEILQSVIDQIGFQVYYEKSKTELAPLRLKDKSGDTLLHKAIKQKNLEAIRLILHKDLTCLDICNVDGKDAIELAVGYPEVFKYLMTLTEAHCANPTCNRTTSYKICSRCRKVSYCSPDCQKAHWPTHKPDCKPKRY